VDAEVLVDRAQMSALTQLELNLHSLHHLNRDAHLLAESPRPHADRVVPVRRADNAVDRERGPDGHRGDRPRGLVLGRNCLGR